MFIPLTWLKEFVSIKVSNEKLAEKLVLSGTKVENIHKKAGEIVFELEITPNRPDTLSVLGVAREISALLGEELVLPETNLLTPQKAQNGKVAFKVREKHLCPSYSIVRIGSIRIQPSSDWIQKYLTLCGIRPINNVVDITNLVMLELGQPMHAFDANKIVGELILRGSQENEVVETLDGIKRKLPQGSIVIEDQEKLIDLAGLMGGKNSEIDQNTREIVLLVPVYDSVAIRKTSLQTGLRTEASTRFEKKLDPNLHAFANNRAIKLLVEECGATLASNIVSFNYPLKERVIEFRHELVNKVLGIELSREEIFDLLTPLGFRISMSPLRESELTIQIPTFRNDVALEEDIVEEIGRMYGYNNFPKTFPTDSAPIQKELFEVKFEETTKEFLLKVGYSQLTGYSLISESDLTKFGLDVSSCLKVLHPTSSEFVYLRPTLLINLVKAFSINKDYSKNSFFEIAKEFNSKFDSKTKLPEQKLAAIFGNDYSLGKIKGEVEALIEKLDINYEQTKLESSSIWDFGVKFTSGKIHIAKVGKLKSSLLAKFEANDPIFFAWLNLEDLGKYLVKNIYTPLPKFPSVYEDISFFLSEKYSISSVIEQLRKVDTLIHTITLGDVYQKNGNNSFTLAFEFLDQSRTLESSEVKKVSKKIEDTLLRKFQAKIRKE